MARKTKESENKAKAAAMAAEAESHGGLVALAGGPWGGYWSWADQYEAELPTSSRRLGYVATDEWIENPAQWWNGVNLRWYGRGRVHRFDGSAVPPAQPPVPTTAWRDAPRLCGCGEHLLLASRERCERCRLGMATERVWGYEQEAALAAARESERLERIRGEEQARADLLGLVSLDAGDAIEPVEQPAAAAPPSAPRYTPEEVANFVWRHLAPLYDR